jgi:hypothetical protein
VKNRVKNIRIAATPAINKEITLMLKDLNIVTSLYDDNIKKYV